MISPPGLRGETIAQQPSPVLDRARGLEARILPAGRARRDQRRLRLHRRPDQHRPRGRRRRDPRPADGDRGRERRSEALVPRARHGLPPRQARGAAGPLRGGAAPLALAPRPDHRLPHLPEPERGRDRRGDLREISRRQVREAPAGDLSVRANIACSSTRPTSTSCSGCWSTRASSISSSMPRTATRWS